MCMKVLYEEWKYRWKICIWQEKSSNYIQAQKWFVWCCCKWFPPQISHEKIIAFFELYYFANSIELLSIRNNRGASWLNDSICLPFWAQNCIVCLKSCYFYVEWIEARIGVATVPSTWPLDWKVNSVFPRIFLINHSWCWCTNVGFLFLISSRSAFDAANQGVSSWANHATSNFLKPKYFGRECLLFFGKSYHLWHVIDV